MGWIWRWGGKTWANCVLGETRMCLRLKTGKGTGFLFRGGRKQIYIFFTTLANLIVGKYKKFWALIQAYQLLFFHPTRTTIGFSPFTVICNISLSPSHPSLLFLRVCSPGAGLHIQDWRGGKYRIQPPGSQLSSKLFATTTVCTVEFCVAQRNQGGFSPSPLIGNILPVFPGFCKNWTWFFKKM